MPPPHLPAPKDAPTSSKSCYPSGAARLHTCAAGRILQIPAIYHRLPPWMRHTPPAPYWTLTGCHQFGRIWCCRLPPMRRLPLPRRAPPLCAPNWQARRREEPRRHCAVRRRSTSATTSPHCPRRLRHGQMLVRFWWRLKMRSGTMTRGADTNW